MSLILITVAFVAGLAAGLIVKREPAPTEFRRYSATDLGLTADEAMRLRMRGAL